MSKYCTKCGKKKNTSSFSKHKGMPDGLMKICRICRQATTKKYLDNSKIDDLEGFKLHNRINHLKRQYKITIEQYNGMFVKQNGKCAICNKHQQELSRNLAIDHNRETGKIRGLLCDSCNMGIGKFFENEKWLLEAANYLKITNH